MQMLMKFEAKSSRVKGLAFHPARTWLLAALHSGCIVLYDYLVGTEVDRFEDHVGPVRGVDFHCTQPLFCSGGDDYKVKVWNYKQKRCLFTLYGHLDYVRTVQFHHEYPWIVSASDDQTVRIWNWQSRQSVAVLNGHNHYVMCARFHPKEDLIVSASLDTTVRVWDISGLRKKRVAPQGGPSVPSLGQSDLFISESVVKFVLEGHDRGVNWVVCHPTLPLIASAADDRKIKIWRMNNTRAWEVDTLRGHFNNVSCVLFHPRQQLLLSNSEDKSIRIWDLTKKAGVQTFRRDKDRFWILAAHPTQNLFAAGHDSGVNIFKLERERPAYCLTDTGTLFYMRDKIVRAFDLENNTDNMVISVKKAGARSMSYNSQEHSALLFYATADSKHYEFYKFPSVNSQESAHSKRGSGLAAVFISRNRFAVLDSTGAVSIKNFSNEVTKSVRLSTPNVDGLFPANAGRVILRTPELVQLWNVQGGKNPVGELAATNVKYVQWSADHKYVAFLSRRTIYIANKELQQLCSVNETIRVKSGAWWDTHSIFVYSTHTHLKYVLPNGDTAIIHTLKRPVYITGIRANKVFVLDRECRVSTLHIDFTEMAFKKAVIDGNSHDVLQIIKRSRLLGQSIIGYLQKKGYSEIALHFVSEPRARFNLALECEMIDVALEAAKVLDDKECWAKLATAALKLGNHQIVELCYLRGKDNERLAFFYVITGNVEGLRKCNKIAQHHSDVMGRFQTAVFLGDAVDRVHCLREAGQLYLAYVSALAHGLEDEAKALALQFPADALPVYEGVATLPPPPQPTSSVDEWAVPPAKKPLFALLSEQAAEDSQLVPAMQSETEPEVAADWDDGLDLKGLVTGLAVDGAAAAPAAGAGEVELGSGWDVGGEPLELPAAEGSVLEPTEAEIPAPGLAIEQSWCENSGLAGVHAAAGSFESAMKILHRQLGIINFSVMKPYFLQLAFSSRGQLSTLPHFELMSVPVRKQLTVPLGHSLPLPLISIASLEEEFKAAYQTTSSANFQLALQQFQAILLQIPLLVVDTKLELSRTKELIVTCREYVSGLRMELARREVQASDPARAAELAIYFAQCDLKPFHHALTLNLAMTGCARIKNFEHASHFARLLLEANPMPQHAKQARDIIHAAGANPQNEHELAYDETKLFSTCQISFVPLYKNLSATKCPYCGAHFVKQHKGVLCPVCRLSEIGRDVSGLKVSAHLR